MILGSDISKWQGSVDFRRMAERGIWFVFIKATEGMYTDEKFSENWRYSHGFLLRGAYHFYRPEADPREQAQHFFEAVKTAGDLGELPPVLDYERIDDWSRVYECLVEMEKLFGRKPIFYTSAGVMSGGAAQYGTPPAALAEYPLWVAHYDVDEPTVPAPWENWTFWQYTDKGSGPEYGVESGRIDLNWFHGSLEELIAFAFSNWHEAAAWLARHARAVGGLKVGAVPVPGLERYRVKVPALRVRKGPGLRYTPVGLLHLGDEIGVTETERADGYTWGKIYQGEFGGKWTALDFCEKIQ